MSDAAVRVSGGGAIRTYVGHVVRALEASEDAAVTLVGRGALAGKAVTVAEIARRRVEGVHQTTQLREADGQPELTLRLWRSEPGEEARAAGGYQGPPAEVAPEPTGRLAVRRRVERDSSNGPRPGKRGASPPPPPPSSAAPAEG